MIRTATGFLFAAAFFCASQGADAVAQAAPVKSQIKNLFIIVFNGVRYNDAIGEKNHLYIDNIWNKLRPLGTLCTKFENTELTFPVPAQMSLLTGVWHVFKNPISKTIRPAAPTLFEYWNSVRKDSINPCYFASSRPDFQIMTSSTSAEFGARYAPIFQDNKEENFNENAIYERALPYITEKHPAFVYLSLVAAGAMTETIEALTAKDCQTKDQKDVCGGAELLNSYYESIILMDQIAYDLWDRVQKIEAYKDKTVFLVLSSHGRHTDEFHGYGDKCKGCTQLFLMAMGPGIKKNFVSDKERTLIDVCKTVGALFNIPTPYAKGDVMKELFN